MTCGAASGIASNGTYKVHNLRYRVPMVTVGPCMRLTISGQFLALALAALPLAGCASRNEGPTSLGFSAYWRPAPS